MIMSILVSVVIPTYGRPDNLSRAISSVLNQTVCDFEVIVVDDNNPGTLERVQTENILDSFQSSKILYIKHDKNLNGATARNTGVKNASGEYIAFLDDDDEFFETKLEYQIDFMKKNNYKFTYCRAVKYKDDNVIYESKYNCSGDLTKDILCSNSDINSSAVLIKRDLFDLVGGFDVSFRRNQDYEFILRCLEFEGLHCFDKAQIKRHVDSKLNHPSFEEYRLIRKSFLDKFKVKVNELSIVDYVDFISLYNFDLARYSARENKILFFKYLFPFFPSFYVLKVLWGKVSTRHFKLFVFL